MSLASAACACGTCRSCSAAASRAAVADPLLFSHGAIKARMLGRIASIEIDEERPLARLSTRDSDDPAIALIDAFAGSLHILAFSAARLSDDSSILRTTDRDALVYLTRMLGYEPRPALSASTTLTFTVNTFAGGPVQATVPLGTKVASVPGQDEKRQTFQTDAELDARAEWNSVQILSRALPVEAATASVVIAGSGTAAKVGDAVLIYLDPQPAGANWLFARIASLVRGSDPKAPQTLIELSSQLTLPDGALPTGADFANRLILLGQRASAFGATAPDLVLMSEEVRLAQEPPIPAVEWSGLVMSSAGTATGGTMDLDAIYPEAMADRFILFSAGSLNQIGRITDVVEHGRVGFALAAKVSGLTVEGIDLSDTGFNPKVRETGIYIETGRETLLPVYDDEEVPGPLRDRLIVPGNVPLPAGRRIVLSGMDWTSGEPSVEVATISSTVAATGQTELIFESELGGHYHSLSLTLLANSVAASHGETMPNNGVEPVGSGDAARLAPRYGLKGSPLTYVSATNARGYAPAIELRVNDRLYTERESLFGLDSIDRAYSVKTIEDGKSELQFAGRLPTGINNVTALYRVGSGLDGNLGADRLTTIMTPVLGIMGVTNEVAAEGGSDAETLDDIRASAPQSIRTLDRVVSLADYEVFARRYRGIGKALATELVSGMRKTVLITIATSTLAPPVTGSDTVEDLRDALIAAGAPRRLIRVEGFTDLVAGAAIALAVDPAFRRSDVEAAVRSALAERFSREARGFGEGLHESMIMAEAAKVEGVVAVRIDSLAIVGGAQADAEGRLLSPAPTLVGANLTLAGLLSIDPVAITFVELAP